MKTLILENTWLSRGITDYGWGNGYVLIPKGHKLHGVEYGDASLDFVAVNGGLTFSEEVDEARAKRMNIPTEYIGYWMIGFDTCHSWDTLEMWPKYRVQQEADKLLAQLQNY